MSSILQARKRNFVQAMGTDQDQLSNAACATDYVHHDLLKFSGVVKRMREFGI